MCFQHLCGRAEKLFVAGKPQVFHSIDETLRVLCLSSSRRLARCISRQNCGEQRSSVRDLRQQHTLACRGSSGLMTHLGTCSTRGSMISASSLQFEELFHWTCVEAVVEHVAEECQTEGSEAVYEGEPPTLVSALEILTLP